ncbi:DNA-binding protein, partial [Xanthomonas campestris]|uniref:DNA-binding protein n=1 Tax=Xanthomonas campestris TaxID=339 RepID=UPI000E362A13
MVGDSHPIDMLDLATIAAAMGISKRAIEMRAIKEKWAYQTRASRGGAKRYYAANGLPAEVQAALFLRSGVLSPSSAAVERVRERRPTAVASAAHIQSAWQRYEAVPQHLKTEAARRLRAL